MGITAAARASFLVGTDPTDDEVHIFARNKGNLTKKRPMSLRYRIVEATVPGLRGESIRTARIEWIGQVDLRASDLLREPEAGKRGREPEQLEAAKALIRKVLADGKEHPSKELDELSSGSGISHPTMMDARRELGVRARSEGFKPKRWFVWLPRNSDSTDKNRENPKSDKDLAKSQSFANNREPDSTRNSDSTAFRENPDSSIEPLGENDFIDSDHRRVRVSEPLDTASDEIEVDL
jgi:hypothetical protein